jgi:hypothetical protein
MPPGRVAPVARWPGCHSRRGAERGQRRDYGQALIWGLSGAKAVCGGPPYLEGWRLLGFAV